MTDADVTGLVEYLDTEIEDIQDHAAAQHVRTDEPADLPYDEEDVKESLRESGYVTADDVSLDDAHYFVAIAVDGWQEINPQEAMMAGIDPESEDTREVHNEDGPDTVEFRVDEATVFLSNEDGDVGHQLPDATVEEASLDGVIEVFSEEYL